MRPVFKQISYTTFSNLLSAPFSLAVSIIAARVLGASEFGQYSLVLSISRFLPIVMGFGIATAVVRYISKDPDTPEAKRILSTAVILVSMLSLAATLVFFFGGSFFSRMLNVTELIFSVSIVYSLIITITQFGRSLHQSKKKFFSLSILEVCNTALSLVSLVVLFYFLGNRTYIGASTATALGQAPVAIAGIYLLYKCLHRLEFDFEWAKKIFSYGKYSAVAALSVFLTIAADKLILNSYFPLATVGIYMAYFTASQAFTINYILSAINTVLFPHLSSEDRNAENYSILRKHLLLVLCGVFILNLISITVLVHFFGKEFPFILSLATLFSLSSSLSFGVGLYTVILNSHDLRGRKITSYGSLVFALLNVALNLILIPHYGMYAAAFISLITNLLYLVTLEIASRGANIISK